MDFTSDEFFMTEALRQARKAFASDEVPVGAVIVRNGEIVGRAWNQVETLKDATAHAEMLAITQAASAVGDWRLTDCELFVTKEPCPMCAGGIRDPQKQINRGAAGSLMNILQMPELNHRFEVSGEVKADECAAILREFFVVRRNQTINMQSP